MMGLMITACMLAALVYGGGGVTKTGVEQFWTDDYKIFEQVYGKTSDKNIYGSSLPASVKYGGDANKQASEKKERYTPTYDLDDGTSDASDTSEGSDNYDYFDRYNSLLAKRRLKSQSKKQPATSTVNFISYSDFKPISQASDPETYSYLKHLEEFNKDETLKYPKTVGGFKPFLNYVGPNPEDSDAYKSIQDILNAHEANKVNSFKSNDEDNVKYVTKGRSKKKKPPRVLNGYSKPRCANARCRKRGSGSVHVGSRPYVRRIKHRVVNY